MGRTDDTPPPVRPEVEVRVSTRRKKTAAAHWEGDRIVVVVPSHLRGPARDDMVDRLTHRMARGRPHLHTSDTQLAERAAMLADRYLEGVRPSSIRWSTNQTSRWGSCTPATREIRISERLRPTPDWVLDSVVVHELAHLIEPGHTERFRDLERRYPRLDDAERYLEGYSLGLRLRDDAP